MNKKIEKAIFFDLDGTLWDAVFPIYTSWNETMKNHNLPYQFSYDQVKSFMGLVGKEIGEKAFKDVDIDTAHSYFDLISLEQVAYLGKHPGNPFENEKEVLETLKNEYPLFIVSNCEQGYIENYLNGLNMHRYFLDHTCVGDTGLEKWQNILYLKNKYNIKNIIYVGDTIKDYEASQKAGVNFIHANYGFGKFDQAKHQINSIKELPNAVKNIFNNLIKN